MPCNYYRYESGLFSGDYYCDKKNVVIDDDTYYRYCKGYNYSECPIYRHEESSGCFITTIICKILGKNDNDRILNDLRAFRDNVLQKNEKYYDILKNYDTIGPIIATCMSQDENKEIIAIDTYKNSIIPIYYLIHHQKYQQAIDRYQLMTQILITHYGLNDEYEKIKNNNYNYENFIPELAGHGKRKLKSIDTTQLV